MLRTFAKLLVILFLSLPTCFAWAFEPSPAGGGWLEVSKPGGYAFVEDHDDFDFDANLGNEFTYEMWMYLKRPPRFRETWVLLHKEGSYLLALEGWKVGLFGAISPLDKGMIAYISYYHMRENGVLKSSGSYAQERLPLNRWHHLTMVGKHQGPNRMNSAYFLNGEQISFGIGGPLGNTDSPLYISGTDIPPPGYKEIEWDQFTGGLIDEVRISNTVRYPIALGSAFQPPRGRFSRDKNTLALWHFDGGRAGWLKDASGNGHTLTDVDLAYFHVRSRGKLPTLWGKIKKRETVSR